MRLPSAAAAVVLTLLATGCAEVREEAADESRTSTTPAAPAATGGYQPGSDVSAHAAIGEDAARVRKLLGAAKGGSPVDWQAVRAVITEGGASRRGDGSPRTLEKLVAAPEIVAGLLEAVDGIGASAGSSDKVRAQRVDKGMTVLLAEKVRDELRAAGRKVAAGERDPATGAPHNVDEAWAFFTADGSGPAATAEKRAADFGLEGKVREPIEAALGRAHRAAVDGDGRALGEASAEVDRGLARIFHLATYKYLDHKGDEVARAEGETFYLGIRPVVRQAVPAADQAVVAAFASGDAAAGRAALQDAAVLRALGVPAVERA